MNILAVETSAKAVSVALGCDGNLLAYHFQNNGLTHSTTLLPMVQSLLTTCGMDIQAVDGFAVAVGPGSFTGLRIGIATIKGLALSRKKPCWGISTLEAMALQSGVFDGLVCSVMDARRNQVYNALFEMENGRCIRRCPDRAVSLAELRADLAKTEKFRFLVGDGAKLCYNDLKEHGIPAFLLPEHLRWQNATGVLIAAFDGRSPLSPVELSANYLRLPQAERERREKLARESAEKSDRSVSSL